MKESTQFQFRFLLIRELFIEFKKAILTKNYNKKSSGKVMSRIDDVIT